MSKYDVILCHNQSDDLVAQHIASLLGTAGLSVWPGKWNLAPGDRYGSVVDEALASCRTCAVLIGPTGLSHFQHTLIMTSLGRANKIREFRVIPVLLPGAERGYRSDLPSFFTQTSWVELNDKLDDPSTITKLADAICATHHSISASSLLDNPYRGLEVFDVEDAKFFFGREALTEWLVNRLRPSRRTGKENRFLAIVGPSGSGKSSLARAGLLASIKDGAIEGSQDWPIAICTPSDNPLQNMALGLCSLEGFASTVSDTIEFIGQMESSANALHIATSLAMQRLGANRIVIAIDQFEELFTVCKSDNQRRAYIRNLLYAATVPSGNTIVILTLRADFYENCAAYAGLAAAMADHQVLVSPLSDDELRLAIQEPARLCGRDFEDGLPQLLIDEVRGQPGGLPLLQHALMELWTLSTDRTMTHEGYRAIGGVHGALSQRATQIYESFSDAEKDVCRRVFLRLTQPGRGTQDTRRRLSLSELVGTADECTIASVVSALSDPKARLITTSRAASEEGTSMIEVSHEAIIRGWPRLASWIDEHREMMFVHRHITDSAREWEQQNRDPGYLYRDTLLARAERFSKTHEHELNQIERLFLAASAEMKVREFLQSPVEKLFEAAKQLGTYDHWVHRSMVARLASEPDSSCASTDRRIRLALLPTHPDNAIPLADSLMTLEVRELLVFLHALQIFAVAEEVQSHLWEKLEINGDHSTNLRALCALATLDPDSSRWESWRTVLASLLTKENQFLLVHWIQTARPIGHRLIGPLRAILNDKASDQSVRGNAMTMLVDFAKSDSDLLAELASEGPIETSGPVLDALGNLDVEDLKVSINALQLVCETPAGGAEFEAKRVSIGYKRAAAAAALIRLGSPLGAEKVLGFSTDPEALTQFVHGYRNRDLPFAPLVQWLSELQDEKSLYGVLLALGEFELDELSDQGRGVEQNVRAIYANDNRSGVHSAAGWLLRTWGIAEPLCSRGGFDHRNEWFQLRVGARDLTFIIFEPGSFLMGSPTSEQGRSLEELQHRVELTRRFAVCDRLVTRAEFDEFLDSIVRSGWETKYGVDATIARSDDIVEWAPTDEHPIVKPTWREAVSYCRWASREVKEISNDRAATEKQNGIPFNLDSSGIRLLTEAEWEYACRAGTTTPYSFGSDSTWLEKYGWYLGNCSDRKSRKPGMLRPNPRGLFDMHGNVYEWCLDWFGAQLADQVNPTGATEGSGRVLRGGGYNYSADDCRSSYRYYTAPTNRNARIGFRLALTLGASEFPLTAEKH